MARAQGSPRRPTMSVLSVRIDSDTMKTLRSYIREGGDGNRSQSKAEVVRVALRRYLKAEGSYWDIVFKRLNRNACEIQTLSHRADVLIELVFHYLDYYFYLWPQIDPQERAERKENAERMLRRFKESLVQKLREGGHLLDFVPEDLQDLMIARARDLEEDGPSEEVEAEGEEE